MPEVLAICWACRVLHSAVDTHGAPPAPTRLGKINMEKAPYPPIPTPGGVPQQLELHVFWLNRPPLMLIPIKLTLFLCSYTYASFIFFLWQFGASSCAFECVLRGLCQLRGGWGSP